MKENGQTSNMEGHALHWSRCACASLPCLWSIRPSWTTAGFQVIGKLCWPGRLLLGPIIRLCCDKGKVLCFLDFPLGNAIHQNPVFCNIRLVTNWHLFSSFPQDSHLLYLHTKHVRDRQALIGNLLPLCAGWMNHRELLPVYNGIFSSFLLSSPGNLCPSELMFPPINDPISLHHCSLDQKLIS